MVDQLDQQSVRIGKVEGPGSIAVCFRFGGQRDAVGADSLSPVIDVFGPPDNETDVVYRLDGR